MPVPTREKALALLTDPVERRGFDLEDVEVTSAGPKSVVRVVVDSDDGLSLDDVVDLTAVASEVLDADESLGASPYTLEVTSRGVDRPLTLQRHWRRARGRRVEATIGDETLPARIGALNEDAVPASVQLVVRTKRGPAIREVPLRDVERAVVQVEFSRPDAREIALSGAAPGGAGAAATGAAKETDK